MIRRLFALFVPLFLFGCFAKHDDPPLLTYDTAALTRQSALLHAVDVNGKSPVGQPQKGLYHVLDTRSMEPLLKGGDYIVVDTKFPYAKLTKGVPITYQAQWQPPAAPPVTHRTQAKYPDGWVCSGDANGINGNRGPVENWRVTEKEFVGKVVGIYRVKP